ncbi:MAG: ABC transporter ATP-binding protein [Alphaproteobacteria bacterium]
MSVAFHNIRKVFTDGTVALDDFNLAFDKGEFVVLLGPSGSGKTTACRILAGLEQASAGHVAVDGRDISDLPPRSRRMSMVFQNYALYAHKSVRDNIAYPLRVRGTPRADISRRVEEVARLLHIEGLLKRRPRQLSGGEAQRVAVARALVWQPDICLMDEPLSNLDAILRLRTRTELKRLHGELGTTFVFVTHDQEEAMTLGTRIAVLDRGRLVQFDAPKEIYHRPATRFVAEFIGRPAMNTLDGRIEDGTFRAGAFALPLPGRPNGPTVLGIRPEHIVLSITPGADTVTFDLDVVELVEPDMLLFATLGDLSVVVRAKAEAAELAPGAQVHLAFPAERLHFFDPESGARLP